MIRTIHARVLTVAAALACLGSVAQAQYTDGQRASHYPYVAQPQYVYTQPQYAPPYPYVQAPRARQAPPQYQPRTSRPPRRAVHHKVRKTDPALAQEPRHEKRVRKEKENKKNAVTVDRKDDVAFDKKTVVRGKPVVDDHSQALGKGRAQHPAAGGRVIHAEAEVTILGPDRMSIRLYRKPDDRDVNAKAPPAKKTTKRGKKEPQT